MTRCMGSHGSKELKELRELKEPSQPKQPREEGGSVSLMRAFARVDAEGKITIPNNIRREVGLMAGQLVELKVVGASTKKNLLVSTRESAR